MCAFTLKSNIYTHNTHNIYIYIIHKNMHGWGLLEYMDLLESGYVQTLKHILWVWGMFQNKCNLRFNKPAYGEQGPAKLSRHKAAKPLNLDHAAKPRSHKATCRHSLTGASQRHKAAKLQKTQNVVEFECTIKSAAKASRNTLACMAGHEPRLWCFSSL